jgi:L-ascorbate metabolism protein UlaG (beta-lactamase superfamily)
MPRCDAASPASWATRMTKSTSRSASLAITWLGHATVLVELDGVRLLTDPVLRSRLGPLVRIAAPIRPHVLGTVDCVLLSHLHADHTDIPTLRALARSGPIVAPHPAGAWLTGRRIPGVRELRPGDELMIGGARVVAVPATHDPRRRPFGPAADPIGYVLSGSSAVYFAGDTDLFDAMERLRGTVDVALLPVWGWGARLGPGHLDPDRAATAAAIIAPTVAIPIHWGTLALGRPARRPTDPERPAREFAAIVKRRAPGVEVRVLVPGERLALSPADQDRERSPGSDDEPHDRN